MSRLGARAPIKPRPRNRPFVFFNFMLASLIPAGSAPGYRATMPSRGCHKALLLSLFSPAGIVLRAGVFTTIWALAQAASCRCYLPNPSALLHGSAPSAACFTGRAGLVKQVKAPVQVGAPNAILLSCCIAALVAADASACPAKGSVRYEPLGCTSLLGCRKSIAWHADHPTQRKLCCQRLIEGRKKPRQPYGNNIKRQARSGNAG